MLADAFVRGYSKNVKRLTDDFYFPTPSEVSSWLKKELQADKAIFEKAFKLEPNLAEDAIYRILRKVLIKRDDVYFIQTGWTTSSGSLVIKGEALKTVFKPNRQKLYDRLLY